MLISCLCLTFIVVTTPVTVTGDDGQDSYHAMPFLDHNGDLHLFIEHDVWNGDHGEGSSYHMYYHEDNWSIPKRTPVEVVKDQVSWTRVIVTSNQTGILMPASLAGDPNLSYYSIKQGVWIEHTIPTELLSSWNVNANVRPVGYMHNFLGSYLVDWDGWTIYPSNGTQYTTVIEDREFHTFNDPSIKYGDIKPRFVSNGDETLLYSYDNEHRIRFNRSIWSVEDVETNITSDIDTDFFVQSNVQKEYLYDQQYLFQLKFHEEQGLTIHKLLVTDMSQYILHPWVVDIPNVQNLVLIPITNTNKIVVGSISSTSIGLYELDIDTRQITNISTYKFPEHQWQTGLDYFLEGIVLPGSELMLFLESGSEIFSIVYNTQESQWGEFMQITDTEDITDDGELNPGIGFISVQIELVTTSIIFLGTVSKIIRKNE